MTRGEQLDVKDTIEKVSVGTIYTFVLDLWRNISPPEMGYQNLFLKLEFEKNFSNVEKRELQKWVFRGSQTWVIMSCQGI